VAGSAAVLVVRRALVMILSAVSTVVIARILGVGDFGVLSAALTTYGLALAAADFGFSLVIGRDLAATPAGAGRLLRTAYRVQIAWSSLLTIAFLAVAVAAGLSDTRGQALAILASGSSPTPSEEPARSSSSRTARGTSPRSTW
jgi:O-antigen/teichoic acid export membrane protein